MPDARLPPRAQRQRDKLFRRRRLRFPARPGIRPTPDRVRETLFNWLGPSIAGARCLDLYAGSGALGLEALSRGAAQAMFVENDRPALDAIRTNIASLGARGTSISGNSVMSLGPARASFDLILADPPYRTNAGEVALDKLLRLGWIGEGAWIALETAFDEEPQIKGLEVDTSRKVGKARLTLMRMETSA